ncbi:probable endochitinase [Achroia grisella]|uniref:probable endochitinase n=1 Tax=Achroia grisella TaxID=688607 RepID=UPI0027D2DB1E|nr:probable endochitinase [Achroia grisella]
MSDIDLSMGEKVIVNNGEFIVLNCITYFILHCVAQATFVLMLAAAVKASAISQFKILAGVDPDSVSCDPAGLEFLLLPSYTDCTVFYMCTHGQEVQFQCPGDLIFDFQLQGCDWDWRATCTLRTPPDEVEGSGDDPSLLREEEENSFVDELSNVARPVNVENTRLQTSFDAILNCQRVDTASIRVAYKRDCQRFWKCLNGVPQVAYCTDGLFFNAATQQCDFEANSKCVVQETNELEGEFLLYN